MASEKRDGTPLRPLDYAIAALLFAFSLGMLAATDDMGFTRDESFYFKYSSVYQDWFARVDQAPADVSDRTRKERGPPLGRTDVVKTWSENFEHPPLAKALFGWSWRVLADKRRPIRSFETDPETGVVRARLVELHDADGFAKGDGLVLLSPLLVKGDRSDEARALGTATVVERKPNEAILEVSGPDLATLKSMCTESRHDEVPPWIAGCQAASSGPLQVMSEHAAMRVPAWVFSALLIFLLYLFTAELFGRWAGLFAALAWLFVPRHFFHAHLCVFDVPVTTLIVATVYAFWKSLRSRVWIGVTSVLWGVGLLTKLNAFFIPLPLIAAWLLPPLLSHLRSIRPRMPQLDRRGWLLHGGFLVATLLTLGLMGGGLALCVALLWATAARQTVRFPPLPRAFLWMPPIGLVMLFALWPRLWYDPANAFYDYVNFHLGHVHYLQQYFGQILSAPPFPASYPWVMTALTVPAPILTAMAVGLVIFLWVERQRTSGFMKVLILANALFPILLISMPSTPIFGGVKHWLATTAFMAIIAGLGFDWLRRQAIDRLIDHPGIRIAATALLLALVITPGAIASVRYSAVGTGYYNSFAGGVRGAADDRMHRQFWGYAGRFALEYLNEHAPRNATVAFHNTTWDAVEWYKRDGMLRKDIRWRRNPTGDCRSGGAFYLFHHQESFSQDRIDALELLKNAAPVAVWGADGVPMLTLYQCIKVQDAAGPDFPNSERSGHHEGVDAQVAEGLLGGGDR